MSFTVQAGVHDGVESRLHMRSDIWSEMLVCASSLFTIHITLILNILDFSSFNVIYCEYEKEDSYSSFPTEPASVLPCFCRRV